MDVVAAAAVAEMADAIVASAVVTTVSEETTDGRCSFVSNKMSQCLSDANALPAPEVLLGTMCRLDPFLVVYDEQRTVGWLSNNNRKQSS
jgi:hypothetical protein